jgi:hypothetical protein
MPSSNKPACSQGGAIDEEFGVVDGVFVLQLSEEHLR